MTFFVRPLCATLSASLPVCLSPSPYITKNKPEVGKNISEKYIYVLGLDRSRTQMSILWSEVLHRSHLRLFCVWVCVSGWVGSCVWDNQLRRDCITQLQLDIIWWLWIEYLSALQAFSFSRSLCLVKSHCPIEGDVSLHFALQGPLAFFSEGVTFH